MPFLRGCSPLPLSSVEHRWYATSRTKMNGREVTRLIPTLQNGSPGVPRLGVFHPAYTKAWHDNQIRTAAQRTVFHGCSNLAG